MVRVIGISSGKGGVGKTTLTTNLGIALSQFRKRTIIVDCNLSTPHLTDCLGADEFDKTLNDVLRKDIDITSALYHHNGVMFVPASTELQDLIDIDFSKLKKSVKKLSNPEMIDFILLDSAPGLGREALSVLDACDSIIFVTNPIQPVVEDVKRSAEVVSEMGKKEMNIVTNMVANKSYELNEREIERQTKIPVLGSIRYDKNVILSLARKKPFLLHKPHSPASADFMKLAANMIGEKYKPSPMKKVFHLFDNLKDIVSLEDRERQYSKKKK